MNYILNFAQRPYFSKLVAGGLIVPLFPIFSKNAYTSPIRWTKLTNLNSNGVVFIQSDIFRESDDIDAVYFSTNRYPHGKNKLSSFDNSEIQLMIGEHVWIGLPNMNVYSIVIHTKDSRHEFSMKTARSWSWFMITH